MAGIDKFLQAGGAAVGRLWRVQAGAVVSPVAISGKLRDRHDLNCGDTEIAKIRKPRNDALKCALGREGAGVEFVDDEVFQRNAGPALIGPAERVGIEDARRTVYAAGLPARNRIGALAFAIENIEIFGAGAGIWNRGHKFRFRSAGHGNGFRVFSQNANCQIRKVWRPDPKLDSAVSAQVCAESKLPCAFGSGYPASAWPSFFPSVRSGVRWGGAKRPGTRARRDLPSAPTAETVCPVNTSRYSACGKLLAEDDLGITPGFLADRKADLGVELTEETSGQHQDGGSPE